jgi:CheY-like chemotaxis protein
VDVLQGKRILVIEDNHVLREGLAYALRRVGCEVMAAVESSAAVALIQGGFLPDVILLDMLTPGLDGWHFFSQRRHDSALARIPVLIVTSLGVASREWAVDLGACGLIRKPIETDLLLEKIRHHFRPANTAG